MLTDTKSFPVIAQRHRVTNKIIGFLIETEKTTITDAELAQVAGGSCAPGGPHYTHFMSARKYVLKNHQRSWVRERKAGCIKLLQGSDGSKAAIGHRTAARRRADTALQTLIATANDTMSTEERQAHSALAAQMGTISLMAKSEVTKALVARKASSTPASADIFALFERTK